jgi:aryl-alcohol dehydrogenase-like predicted oxidoreductase
MSGNVQLGLGCSRFGSLVAGLDRAGAKDLVTAALDLGVRDFDTANIYGQGDSERFLGAALRGLSDVCITTKAGQVFLFKKRAMIPLKHVLKPIVNRLKSAQGAVSNARAAELPRNWSRTHLTQSLDRSLQRLGREAVEIFLLHSPSAQILRDGDAMATLADLKKAGKAIRVGASVDDEAALAAALADPRVEVVQFVQNPTSQADPALLSEARQRGVILIAREILDGATDPNAVDAALEFAGRQPVDVTLLGTRRIANLRHAYSKITGV